jgi:hypothetical protein
LRSKSRLRCTHACGTHKKSEADKDEQAGEDDDALVVAEDEHFDVFAE